MDRDFGNIINGIVGAIKIWGEFFLYIILKPLPLLDSQNKYSFYFQMPRQMYNETR